MMNYGCRESVKRYYMGKLKYSGETSPCSTLSTRPTSKRLGLTSALQSETSASDRLSHGMTSSGVVHCHCQNKLMKICINKQA